MTSSPILSLLSILKFDFSVVSFFVAQAEMELLRAARKGHSWKIKYLLWKGYDPNFQHPDSQETPLICAITNKQTRCVKILLKAGANTELHDYTLWYPLHYAVCFGNDIMVLDLLDAGADVQTINGIGSSPLVLACINRRFDIVKPLVEKGSDIDSKNSKGNSPLSTLSEWRTYFGRYKFMKEYKKVEELIFYLLDKGANSQNIKEDCRKQVLAKYHFNKRLLLLRFVLVDA